MPIIEVRDVSKEYRLGEVRVPALRGVSFNVEPGEFLGLTGPSGSGKSTLLHILGCLDAPSSGAYRFAGQEVVCQDHDQLAPLRAEKMGFVFQSFNLLPVLTAVENVELPSIWCPKRTSESERRARALSLLDEVGLAAQAHRYPTSLSGGQQQRVAIARALINSPALVLADEPTANLDSSTAESIIQLMVRLSRAHQTTFVVATHDPTVSKVADRILQLRDGVIERRLDRRVTAQLAGSYAVSVPAERVTIGISEVSDSGLLVQSATEVPLGAVLDLRLDLPDGKPAVPCTGRVVHVAPSERGFRIGVRILDVSSEDSARLYVWSRQHDQAEGDAPETSSTDASS